jgi:hypothetical protein
MGLDEAGHGDIAKLVGQHGRPRHFGAKLGGSEARGEGQQGTAEAQAKGHMPEGQTEPDRCQA